MKKKWMIIGYHDKNRCDEIIHDYRNNVQLQLGIGIGMISAGYDTKEELVRELKIPDWKCSKCGGVVALHYNNSEWLEKDKMCFNCNFWHSIVLNNRANRIVIDGTCYHYEKDNPNAAFQGFGGRQFTIKTDHGVIVTHNLWCNGDIPERFRDVLPDNAKFIKNE